MNRLQKKCFIAATGLHLLLMLLLVVGPGFLAPSSKTENLPELNFMPVKFVDSLMSGGGSPKGGSPPPPAPVVTPPPPAPTPVAPPPEPVKVAPPDPPKTRTPDPVPSLEATTKPVRPKIVIDGKIVTRNTRQIREEAQRAADEQARERAEQQRRIASAISSAVSGIQSDLSPNTTIELKGPGGGGVPYGNWLAAVKKVYTDAWLVPDGVTDNLATVTVSVTIARDGTVISSSVTRSSSNALVNHSVEAALNRVRFAPPLPDGASESQRTVTINFNLKAKQLLG